MNIKLTATISSLILSCFVAYQNSSATEAQGKNMDTFPIDENPMLCAQIYGHLINSAGECREYRDSCKKAILEGEGFKTDMPMGHVCASAELPYNFETVQDLADIGNASAISVMAIMTELIDNKGYTEISSTGVKLDSSARDQRVQLTKELRHISDGLKIVVTISQHVAAAYPSIDKVELIPTVYPMY